MAPHAFLNEKTIAAFLAGTLEPQALDREVRSAVERVDDIRTRVFVRGMSTPLVVSVPMAVSLCDAAIDQRIAPESLRVLAFAVVASDRFEWNDEVVAEVLHDWSAPEINYPLTPENLRRFRMWLLREEPYPEKSPLPSGAHSGTIISELEKIPS